MTTQMTRAGVLETFVDEDDLQPIHTSTDDTVDGAKLSKSIMAAFRRAKKASHTQDTKACKLCAELRTKRGETEPAPPQSKPEDGEQSSLFDF